MNTFVTFFQRFEDVMISSTWVHYNKHVVLPLKRRYKTIANAAAQQNAHMASYMCCKNPLWNANYRRVSTVFAMKFAWHTFGNDYATVTHHTSNVLEFKLPNGIWAKFYTAWPCLQNPTMRLSITKTLAILTTKHLCKVCRCYFS